MPISGAWRQGGAGGWGAGQGEVAWPLTSTPASPPTGPLMDPSAVQNRHIGQGSTETDFCLGNW